MEIELIRKIVRASGVKEGELILIHFWGEDSKIDIMHNFAVAVTELGASPLELQQSRSHNKSIFDVAKKTSFDNKYYSIFEKVDAVLDVFVYQPVVLKYEIADEQMDLYRNYVSKLFRTLMERKRFTQIRIPTVENAQESNLDPNEYIERMTKAYDIDYTKLRILCEEKINKLKGAKQIILKSENDCSLKIVTGNREWFLDCGDGDLPCGEVYIAPIEENTEGNVYYKKLFIEDLGEFKDVILTIKDGILINSNNKQVNDFIAGNSKENRVVCELGFGLNEKVTSLCGYVVLDEKMFNTFHIAIGDNTMFGGNNKADLHMDFVGTADLEIIK